MYRKTSKMNIRIAAHSCGRVKPKAMVAKEKACKQNTIETRIAQLGGLTLDMKSPNAPPRAKPMPPAMTAFVGHASIAACICARIVSHRVKSDEKGARTVLTICCS